MQLHPQIHPNTPNRYSDACTGVYPDTAGGIIGHLPNFFDIHYDWPSKHSLFTNEDGGQQLPYETGRSRLQGHVDIFADMKIASGLQQTLQECATKLRAFGAMAASMRRASHPEIERTGRYAW